MSVGRVGCVVCPSRPSAAAPGGSRLVCPSRDGGRPQAPRSAGRPATRPNTPIHAAAARSAEKQRS